MDNLELQKTANEVRKGIITAVYNAKSGHPGGSLSAADIYTYLYFEEMNIDPENPKKADRDRLVVSKGHTSPGYYSALAHRGFFPVEDLKTFRHVGSYLQGHPDMKHIPGVDMSSGSSDREFLRQSEWPFPRNYPEMTTVYTHWSETERFRKDRCGRHLCLQVTESLTILL